MREITLKELKQMCYDTKDTIYSRAGRFGTDPKVYLHWTAGHYDQTFGDYHINITKEGKLFVSVDDLSTKLNHTYFRNTGGIGVTLTCCAFATSEDIGDPNKLEQYGEDYLNENKIPHEPPTNEQIEMMAKVITVICNALELPIDLEHVMAHGEAGDNLDGFDPGYPDGTYGPDSTCERWDLAILKNGDEWKSGGNILRGKANWYNDNYPNGVENEE